MKRSAMRSMQLAALALLTLTVSSLVKVKNKHKVKIKRDDEKRQIKVKSEYKYEVKNKASGTEEEWEDELEWEFRQWQIIFKYKKSHELENNRMETELERELKIAVVFTKLYEYDPAEYPEGYIGSVNATNDDFDANVGAGPVQIITLDRIGSWGMGTAKPYQFSSVNAAGEFVNSTSYSISNSINSGVFGYEAWVTESRMEQTKTWIKDWNRPADAYSPLTTNVTKVNMWVRNFPYMIPGNTSLCLEAKIHYKSEVEMERELESQASRDSSNRRRLGEWWKKTKKDSSESDSSDEEETKIAMPVTEDDVQAVFSWAKVIGGQPNAAGQRQPINVTSRVIKDTVFFSFHTTDAVSDFYWDPKLGIRGVNSVAQASPPDDGISGTTIFGIVALAMAAVLLCAFYRWMGSKDTKYQIVGQSDAEEEEEEKANSWTQRRSGSRHIKLYGATQQGQSYRTGAAEHDDDNDLNIRGS